MKGLDHSLDRLLRSAARTPGSTPESQAFAVEMKVLANWRAGEVAEDGVFLLDLFRRAVVFAGFVMVLSLACGWLVNISESPSKTTLANYALTVQLRP
jgi:hypothetical protein